MNPDSAKKYVVTLLPLLLVLLALFGVFTQYHQDINHLLLDDVDKQLTEIAFQNAATIDTQIDGDMNLIKALANYFSNEEQLDFTHLKKAIFAENNRNSFKRMTVIDDQGFSHFETGAPVDTAKTAAAPTIQEALNGKFAISAVHDDPREPNKKIYVYAAPIFGNDDNVVDVILAVRAADIFLDTLNRSSYDGKAWSIMIDRAGNEVAFTTRPESRYRGGNYFDFLRHENHGDDAVEIDRFIADLRNHNGGKLAFGVTTGEKRISSYTPLRNNSDWYVISVLPTDQAMATADLIFAIMWRLTIIVGGLFAVLLAFNYYTQRKARLVVETAMAQLKIMADNVPGGVITTNIDDHFTMIYANQGFYDLAGITPEYLREHCGNASIAFVHPDDVKPVGEKVKLELARCGEVSDEHRMRKADGAIIWVALRGRKIVLPNKREIFNAIITDITERKLQEAELLKTQAELQTLTTSVPGGVVHTLLDDNFTVLYCNQGYLDLIGTTAAEFAARWQKSTVAFIHPEDRERVLASARQQLSVGDEMQIEHRILPLNGEEIWVLVRGRKVPEANGTATFYGIVFDITPVKKAEAERLSFMSQIELAAAKEKAKNMFLANISHDIRTPINAIIGMTYFLNKTELNAVQHGYLNKMKGAAEILQQLVNDILDLAKMSENKLTFSYEAFSLYEVTAQAIDMFFDKCEQRGVKLCLDYELPPNLFVVCDRTRVFQVIMNLLSNAAKFTEKGAIAVSVKKLNQSAQDVEFAFAVADTGIGIPEDSLTRIWNEFEQVENSLSKFYQGTGLGLSLCKRIIEQLGGNIIVTSVVGQGTTFTFTLKLRTEKSEVGTGRRENGGKETSAQMHGKRILLVEDNEINSEIGKMVIEDLGMICDTAFDGVEAIQICSNKPTDYYAAILTDIHMPRMDGYQTANILKREMLIKSPIFALTATVLDEKILEDYKEVFSGVLTKPIAPDVLARKLTAIFTAR